LTSDTNLSTITRHLKEFCKWPLSITESADSYTGETEKL
jgi:hypothetical protein